MPISTEQAIDRFKENEERVNKFVNEEGQYTTNTTPAKNVQTLPSFIADMISRYSAYHIKGDWTTSTAYILQDIVTKDGIAYMCLVAHTAGVFATDLTAGKWAVYQGVRADQLGIASAFGSEPDSGQDEGQRLNNALAACRVVQLEEGVYLTSKGLRQVLHGSVIRGRGKNKTIIRAISPSNNGKFGGTSGSEAVVWAEGAEGNPLYGLMTEDLTIDCGGLWTGLPSGDVRLKAHHYRRIHGFEVNRVSAKECGSYAFWANDKIIESGGVQTGCIGEYNDCDAVDASISFETTGNCWVTYNRPRAQQTRSSWAWSILESYHFYGGAGLITVNDGYAKGRFSTAIGPALTQKNVTWNGGYYEQLDPATTVINLTGPGSNYDNWTFNEVELVGAGEVGPVSIGELGEKNNKITFNGGKYIGKGGSGLTFTSTTPEYGYVNLIGVDGKSITEGAQVPYSLIVVGEFKSFNVVGGSQEVSGPSVGLSPVNAPSARFIGVDLTPSSTSAPVIRQSVHGRAVFVDGGGMGQINLAMPANVADKNKLVISGAVEASSTSPTGAGEGVAITWNNPDANIINILAPSSAIGRSFNYLIQEFE